MYLQEKEKSQKYEHKIIQYELIDIYQKFEGSRLCRWFWSTNFEKFLK
jgi:hypothetical protein